MMIHRGKAAGVERLGFLAESDRVRDRRRGCRNRKHERGSHDARERGERSEQMLDLVHDTSLEHRAGKHDRLTATYTGAIRFTEIDTTTGVQLLFTPVEPTTVTVTNPANGKSLTGMGQTAGEILKISARAGHCSPSRASPTTRWSGRRARKVGSGRAAPPRQAIAGASRSVRKCCQAGSLSQTAMMRKPSSVGPAACRRDDDECCGGGGASGSTSLCNVSSPFASLRLDASRTAHERRQSPENETHTLLQ